MRNRVLFPSVPNRKLNHKKFNMAGTWLRFLQAQNTKLIIKIQSVMATISCTWKPVTILQQDQLYETSKFNDGINLLINRYVQHGSPLWIPN